MCTIKCEICERNPTMFWKDKTQKNGRSELFFTNKNGKTVCPECLTDNEVNSFRGLYELNNERKNNYEKRKTRQKNNFA